MQSDVTQIDQSPTLKRPTSGNRATSNIAAGTLAKQPVNTEGIFFINNFLIYTIK
jgi:hypothetical protein